MEDVIEVCSICGREFILGENGTGDGCDACTGVERDAEGKFWLPGEMKATYIENGTGREFTKKRPENLR